MKRKKLKMVLICSVIILLIVFLGMSYFIGIQVFKNSTQLATNESTTGVTDSFWEKYQMNYDEFTDRYRIEEFKIESSFDGHTIPGDYIYSEDADGKNWDTVVLVHGLGGNRYSNYPLAEYFLGKGYNVITYDQRSSGENTAQYTTFGYWEKYDAIDMARYAGENAPKKQIGFWGTSFGGATVGLALADEKMNELVDFAVLDSPVSSMESMVAAELGNMNIGIPVKYMMFCGNIINRQKLGFSYAEAEVPDVISDTKVPLLIINSKADTLTPYFMGKDIYDAVKQDQKQIWTVKDSGHAGMWLDYNGDYRAKMDGFLEEYAHKQ